MPTRTNLWDELVDQAEEAAAILGPSTAKDNASLDPAVMAERQAREDASAASIAKERRRRSDTWLRTMMRLLPATLRDQARILLDDSSQAQVASRTAARHDMAQWRRDNRIQIHTMRRLLDDKQARLTAAKKATIGLVAYVVRTRPKVAVEEPKREHPYAADLAAWRDPDAFKAFLLGAANTPKGLDPRVDLARDLAARRSTMMARKGATNAATSRRTARRAHHGAKAERMIDAINMLNQMRPQERTKAGDRMRERAPDLAAFFETGRARALTREMRCWMKAYRLAGAHQFNLAPTSIAFAESAGQAKIIGHGGVDVSSPAAIHASLASQGPWEGHEGRKPFRSDALVEHLIITLPKGYDRDDVDEQLLYRAHRGAARLGLPLSEFPHVISRHFDADHEHAHVLISRIRIADGAVAQLPSSDTWRALSIDRDVMERQWQRVNDLDESPTFAAISGFDIASRTSSLALELGKAAGKLVHLDGTREPVPIYGQEAANRVMRSCGFQADVDLLPSCLAKLVPHNPDLDAEMSEFDNLVLYVLRIR